MVCIIRKQNGFCGPGREINPFPNQKFIPVESSIINRSTAPGTIWGCGGSGTRTGTSSRPPRTPCGRRARTPRRAAPRVPARALFLGWLGMGKSGIQCGAAELIRCCLFLPLASPDSSSIKGAGAKKNTWDCPKHTFTEDLVHLKGGER